MSHNRANIEWNINSSDGSITWDLVPIAVLMDIRSELQILNRLLGCENFTRIPFVLDEIKRNTKKPLRKKAAR